MSDMSQRVTVRRLQRETSALLREVETNGTVLVVTRDDEEVALLLPISPVEREWRRLIRDGGGDPDDAAWDVGDVTVPPAQLRYRGEPLSQVLARMRDEER